MPRSHLRAAPSAGDALREAFTALRDEFDVPGAFPPEVLDEADEVVHRGPDLSGHADLREVPFRTIDPAGSMDLDQAMHIERDGDGFRIRYAIVDLDAWFPSGGAIDTEARRRGTTLYLPDGRVPLYPPAVSEAAASLLPDGDRPAIVFHIPVAADGEVAPARLFRAVIRSRERLEYADGSVPGLGDVGRALTAAALRRGAIRIDMPGQEVVRAEATGEFTLRLDERVVQEDWNAQVSLAANICAAQLMAGGRTGLFRVMGAADPVRAAGLRAAAVTLGLAQARDGDDLRALAAMHGTSAAVDGIRRSARGLPRGAAYLAHDGSAGFDPWHAAVAAPYAHATAPLRRLADRYVLDLAATLSAGGDPDRGTPALMAEMATIMNESERRNEGIEAAAVNLVEATMLASRVGERFPAVVTGTRNDGVTIQLRDPVVRAGLADVDGLSPGDELEVELAEADPDRRVLRFVHRA